MAERPHPSLLFVPAGLLTLLLVLSFLAVPASPASAGSYQWQDTFQYATLQQLEAAGWIAGCGCSNVANYVIVGTGVLTLDNDGGYGGGVQYNSFPSDLSGWSVQDSGRWTGRNYGSLTIFASTASHSYGLLADGYYPEFAFLRDGVKVLTFAGYTPRINQWRTLALSVQGNTITMSVDGQVVNTYTEIDNAPMYLTSVGIDSGWEATTQWNSISVTAQSASVATTTTNPPTTTTTKNTVLATPTTSPSAASFSSTASTSSVFSTSESSSVSEVVTYPPISSYSNGAETPQFVVPLSTPYVVLYSSIIIALLAVGLGARSRQRRSRSGGGRN